MPNDFDILLTGADEAIRALRGVRLDAFQAVLADILEDMAKDAAVYPPELPGQKYQRTQALERGWLDSVPIVALQGVKLTAALENSTPHGPYVMSIEDQATIHVGRWRTTDKIMESWEDRAAARVEDELGRIIGV